MFELQTYTTLRANGEFLGSIGFHFDQRHQFDREGKLHGKPSLPDLTLANRNGKINFEVL